MLDTEFLRSQVDQTRDIGMEFAADLAEDYIPDLCDELDAARAALAAAEARAEQEHARAERLAAYANALAAYDEQLMRPTIETTGEAWRLGSAVNNAAFALQPGDLGEEAR